MPVFTRSTRVRAPLDSVWEFHVRGDGLEALTPEFLNLRVERVVSADGDHLDRLEAGARVAVTVKPFGIARRGWTSVITELTERPGTRIFVDEMEDGPFPRWEHHQNRRFWLAARPEWFWRHTHAFYADGSETLIRDRIEYELPVDLGPLGRLGPIGFEPVFRYRHRRTKALLH